MKKISKKCDKCGHALKFEDICDNCGKTIDYPNEIFFNYLTRKTIDYPNEIFFNYLTITRTNPEGKDEWRFQFCSVECMIIWMTKRTINKKHAPTSPYDWEQEIRDKFNIHF
jgi:hypothetical protein